MEDAAAYDVRRDFDVLRLDGPKPEPISSMSSSSSSGVYKEIKE